MSPGCAGRQKASNFLFQILCNLGLGDSVERYQSIPLPADDDAFFALIRSAAPAPACNRLRTVLSPRFNGL
ncbi:hypothetical protein DPM35_26740 [Mesorhizobium atlanticum]|uniref:Uncharacterized protein n=1 Tax=Mesorhizobium atlanticum TaxID=2233532 RepID=A0A330GQ00_9HYPH|nr:hypothetical protein DPM35_26740 [Mesorhizobium atlanticum]